MNRSMGGIFINYRTVDAALGAVLLDQRLTARFGADAVFRDSRSLDLATEFEPALWRRLRRSDLVLVVIGPHWLSESRGGRRLIDHPDDFVRREIAEALRLDIDVLPVLIGDSRLPTAADLPKDLRGLAGRQAYPVRARDPEPDLDRLVDKLAGRGDLPTPPAPPAPDRPSREPAGEPGGGVTITTATAGRDFIVGDQHNAAGGGA